MGTLRYPRGTMPGLGIYQANQEATSPPLSRGDPREDTTNGIPRDDPVAIFNRKRKTDKGDGLTSKSQKAIWEAMSEDELAYEVEGIFRLGGWNFYHPYRGEKAETILDYIAWRERAIWVELKTMHGRLTKDRIKDGHFIKGQTTVIHELLAAGQEIYLWRPSDISEIERILVHEPRRVTIGHMLDGV